MNALLFVVMLFLFPLMAQAQALCPHTGEQEQCLNTKLERVVADLQSNLSQIEARFHNNPVLLAALEQSQSQWNIYRKQECGNVYLLWQNKPDQHLMTVSCSIRLARSRNAFLQQTYLPD